MIGRLITGTRQRISDMLREARHPVLLCSFGKDSMVMLALVCEQRPDIEVVYFPVFDHPTKHQFANTIIQDWKLNMVEWIPCERDVIGKGSHVEIVETYPVAVGVNTALPIEAEDGHIPTSDSHCAIERLTLPCRDEITSDVEQMADVLFIGHRGDDVDPTHGAVPLVASTHRQGNLTFAYPLFDWTEQDIWEASKLLSIPQNLRRYQDASLAHNADYFDLCTQCLTPGMKGPMVPCPKGGEVFNLGRHLDLDARREALRSRFVNIASDLSKSY